MSNISATRGDFIGGNNTACNSGLITSGLPIPSTVSWFVVSAPLNDTGMQACCAPNAVNLVENCFLWCELPWSYINDGNKKIGQERANTAFRGCLKISVKCDDDYCLYSHLIRGTDIKKIRMT
ncbi:hypothetical protein B0H63DRAFT_536012 [Podospora didyma]|uniref:Uncharacterized protein n=1 Tax=Podospora didyma TaxID=330526 RepID=A0AAE0N1Y5_9PEZI|nr:hypothetical protein B0H63DRAFT_536012 [Podospora didyma]